MIKLERTQVMGLEPAIRGMRNPMNSWDKSDSCYCHDRESCGDCPHNTGNGCDAFEAMPFIIGPNDHDLAMRLIKGGPVEAKFRRQIFVSVDITAPLYWWKEFDTYKVGTVANSCSTMHKIHAKEFVLEDFSHEKLLIVDDAVNRFIHFCDPMLPIGVLEVVIKELNFLREKFLETKDKCYWDCMIQLLPTSYNQMRTITFNYEVLAGMYKSRKNHKLQEWRDMCEWMLTLPYPEFITGKVGEDGNI